MEKYPLLKHYQKTDKKYMVEAVNAQVEIAKSDVKQQGYFMKLLKKISQKISLLPKKKNPAI